MFRKPTVVILGAGANFELGLPLGKDLMITVETALRFDALGNPKTTPADEFRDALRNQFGKDYAEYIQAAGKLVQVMDLFTSMDEALHYVSADPRCITVGKAAIVSSIIGAEAGCKLKFDGRLGTPDLPKASDTWLPEFLSMATANLTQEEMPTIFDGVTFINFNYDRSLEHYLFWALILRARLLPKRAKDIVDRLRVIRPYGTVGIDWGGDGGGLMFGRPDRLDASVFQAADKIRTFTEQHAAGIQEEIARALTRGRLFLILGFGFHGQNFRLFNASDGRQREPRHVFATAYKIAEENHQGLRSGLAKRLCTGIPVQLLPKTARQMLVDLRPSIMEAAN